MFVFNADAYTYEQAYDLNLGDDPILYHDKYSHMFFLPETRDEQYTLEYVQQKVKTNFSLVLYQLKHGWFT